MKIILKVFSSLFFIMCVSSCSKVQQKEEKYVRPVKYQEVKFSGGERKRTFSGTAQTDKIINLSFRNTGIITTLDIELGQKVEKGKLLAKLDNVQSRLSHEQALTQLNTAASQLKTSKLSLDRSRTLYEKGSASLSDFESAKNAYKAAQESHESAKRGVAIENEKVRFGLLYAPENGIISAVNVEIDENVNSGQVVAVLNAGLDMEVLLGLPESVINLVQKNMSVDVGFPSLAKKVFKAIVTEVSPSLDSNTSTYPVRVKIIKSSKEIKSGMAANVTFDFANHEESKVHKLVVPASSVGEDNRGRFVFVIETSGEKEIAKKRHVTIGQLTPEGFEIEEGLQIHQKIATAGLQTLLDGQEVRLK